MFIDAPADSLREDCLLQNQQTDSEMNEPAKATSHITFPKMFPDYARGTAPLIGEKGGKT
jgi:hypothetical protein